MNYGKELQVASDVARQAGKIAEDYRQKGVKAEEKEDESPVTAADKACEKLIIETLDQVFPGDGFLGEEGADRPGTTGRRWIIDPIDGTRDFVRGIPLWSILIGLEVEGDVVAGVAHTPGQNLLLSASKGNGTYANGVRVQVQDKDAPNMAVLCFNGFHKPGVQHLGPDLLSWVSRFWAVRGLGGAVDAMLLASGSVDIWVEPKASPWDLAAPKIIIEEAGGVFTGLNGKRSIYEGNAVAYVPGLKSYVKQLLVDYPG